MDQETQTTAEQNHFAFRVSKEHKDEFLRQVSEDLQPYKFLTVEQAVGDDILIVVIPASSEPVVRAKLAALESQLNLTARADSPAADRGDDLQF